MSVGAIFTLHFSSIFFLYLIAVDIYMYISLYSFLIAGAYFQELREVKPQAWRMAEDML